MTTWSRDLDCHLDDFGSEARDRYRQTDWFVAQSGNNSSHESGISNTKPGSRDPSSCADAGVELSPAELIEKHQRGIWRYLRMLGCDASTADDLTQETFLRVLRRDNFVQHNDTATAGYLRRTAYNLLVSRHRKLGKVRTVGEPAVLDEIWDRWAGKDLAGDIAIESLKECLGGLTERARTALRMRFAEGASRVEIGDALGITDHGARNLMQRAKAQLRECVQERLHQTNIQ
ncbi:MAG: sigma-70 family RNA polymerase sigma factor [Planctomycetota bacterium]